MKQLGRNEPCPCGSGRKYKRCCLSKEQGGIRGTDFLDPFSQAPKYLRSGYQFPPLEKLKKADLKQLRSTYFNPTEWQWGVQEITGLDKNEGFAARRLPRGELDFQFKFSGTNSGLDFYRRHMPARFLPDEEADEKFTPCTTILQEAFDRKNLIASCTCSLGKKNEICNHLFGAAILLWSMLRQDSHDIFNDDQILYLIEKYESRLDLILERSARPNPDAGIQLTALILHLPSGENSRGETSSVENLPGMKPSQFAEISGGIIPNFFSKVLDYRLVPSVLNDSRWDRSYTQNKASGRYGAMLQYSFSNGIVLNAGELLNHRWLKLVPFPLLPVTPERSSELTPQWASFFPTADDWSSRQDRQGCRVILEVIAHALSSAVNLPVWLVESSDRKKKRSAIPLRSLDFSAGALTQCRMIPGPEDNQARLQFIGDTEKLWERDGDRLIFHSGFFTHSLLCGNLGRTLVGQEIIQYAVDSMGHDLAGAGLAPLELPPTKVLADSEMGPEIWLSSAGQISYSMQIPSVGVRVWNWQPTSLLWQKLLREGIGSTVAAENSEIASQNRGSKREMDLKVLRHCGFAAALFSETAGFALEGVTSTGEAFASFSAFQSWLKKRLATIVAALNKDAAVTPKKRTEKIDSPTLDSFISARVRDLIQTTISNIYEELRNNQKRIIYLSDQWIEVHTDSQAFAQLAGKLIEKAALLSFGKCFLKVRIPVLFSPLDSESHSRFTSYSVFAQKQIKKKELKVEMGPRIQTVQALEPSVSPFQALWALLPLQSKGFALYWESQPVHLLANGDLQTIFDIQNSPKSSVHRGPLDWFELHPQIFLMGREVSRKELETVAQTGVVEHQGRLYIVPESKLPSIRRLSRFWENLTRGQASSVGGFAGDSSYTTLPRSEALEFLALENQLSAEVKGEVPGWSEVREFYKSLDLPRPPLQVPKSVRAELKHYQRDGVQWLLDLHRLRLGGILADDMGLGKTLQALTFLEILRTKKKLGACLIVVPTSLGWNWKSEATRFTPDLPITLFDSKRKKELEKTLAEGSPLVLIVTYGLLTEHADWFSGSDSQFNWNIALFDEAQNLKNIQSRRTEVARTLRTDYKYCLTGTPLENHLGELYSLLELVVPGCVGERAEFKARYENLTIPGEFELETKFLKSKIKPLLLRRSKANILTELPSKTESRIELPLEAAQKKIYRDVALAWTKQINESVLKVGESKSQLLMLTALLRLRQVCSDPACLPGVKYPKIPPKLELLAESLPEILDSGESAIIFTQFLPTLERLRKYFVELGIPHGCIHGAVPRGERERILKNFQESPQASVLIMTLKTGGVGLNLTRASYVFHMEPWWNPAVENQATDRAHRMGQTRPVQVYRYIMKETLEEKMEILKQRKSAIFTAIMDDSVESSEESPTESKKRSLTQSDFDLLLQ